MLQRSSFTCNEILQIFVEWETRKPLSMTIYVSLKIDGYANWQNKEVSLLLFDTF